MVLLGSFGTTASCSAARCCRLQVITSVSLRKPLGVPRLLLVLRGGMIVRLVAIGTAVLYYYSAARLCVPYLGSPPDRCFAVEDHRLPIIVQLACLLIVSLECTHGMYPWIESKGCIQVNVARIANNPVLVCTCCRPLVRLFARRFVAALLSRRFSRYVTCFLLRFVLRYVLLCCCAAACPRCHGGVLYGCSAEQNMVVHMRDGPISIKILSCEQWL